jgi:hypothetical protein
MVCDMTEDRDSAAASLSDIESAERRTFEAVFYGISSSILVLWGVATAAGYVFTHFFPRHAYQAWPIIDALGFVVMLAILRRKGIPLTPKQRKLGWRLVSALIALIVFGIFVVLLLGPFDGRRLNAFWPMLFTLGYVLAGIWVGRFFILCGGAIALLTMAGYWWSGPWYSLWMAAVNGGALILGGWWLRRRGASL